MVGRFEGAGAEGGELKELAGIATLFWAAAEEADQATHNANGVLFKWEHWEATTGETKTPVPAKFKSVAGHLEEIHLSQG